MNNQIKVCYMGDYSGHLDEGIKNISYHLSHEYSGHIVITRSDISKIYALSFWRTFYKNKPDIIHYLAGPSLFSLVIANIMKRIARSRLIISATHPAIGNYSYNIARFFRPDLILTQSDDHRYFFENIGFNVRHLANGVDLDTFHMVTNEEKNRIRNKYGFSKDDFVILHVGHMTRKRGLNVLEYIRKNIQDENLRFLLIISTHAKIDKSIERTMNDLGCLIYKGYFENIEDFYHLSDLYIFPVVEGNSVATPLSVLEAIACGLPVISRKFGSLSKMFDENDGLYIFHDCKSLLNIINNIKNNRDLNNRSAYRNKIHMYSWSRVKSELEEIYETYKI